MSVAAGALLWKKTKCLSPVVADQEDMEHALRFLVKRGAGELMLSLVRASIESVPHVKRRFQLVQRGQREVSRGSESEQIWC